MTGTIELVGAIAVTLMAVTFLAALLVSLTGEHIINSRRRRARRQAKEAETILAALLAFEILRKGDPMPDEGIKGKADEEETKPDDGKEGEGDGKR